MDRSAAFRLMTAASVIYGLAVGLVASISGGLTAPVASVGAALIGVGWALAAFFARPSGGGRDRSRNR
ncbi:hypothetical protein [Actinomadura harenae]|uniref:Uncharacterized protein n=1 Tax=Actinomadura harenae TaxID=2483351 RepID=A0A3M2M8M2_9ACTN|nr:hypothetical protein [Actinomadura harenae]RMI43478.1 hypothetical protein EBO15_16145 [Actinomadura harenae]